MKKTQLRKVIRELIKEQLNPQPKKVRWIPCSFGNHPWGIAGSAGVVLDRNKRMLINGQTPQFGDVFNITLTHQDIYNMGYQQGHSHMPTNKPIPVKIVALHPPCFPGGIGANWPCHLTNFQKSLSSLFET